MPTPCSSPSTSDTTTSTSQENSEMTEYKITIFNVVIAFVKNKSKHVDVNRSISGQHPMANFFGICGSRHDTNQSLSILTLRR